MEFKTKIKNISQLILKTEIDEQNSIENTESWDSLNHINLIMELEKTFNVSFDDNEIVEADSIYKIIKIIESKIS